VKEKTFVKTCKKMGGNEENSDDFQTNCADKNRLRRENVYVSG
jgi:hypothetical protein